MAEIVCYNSDGSVFEYFTQWDRNQSIIINGADTSSVPVLHFYNKFSKNALVVNASVKDKSIHAPVPNILLQDAEPVTVHLFYTNEKDSSSKSKYSLRLPVMPKPRPDDLLYTEVISGITHAAATFTTDSNGACDYYLGFVPDVLIISCGSYAYAGETIRTDLQFAFYQNANNTIRQASAYSKTDQDSGYPYINATVKRSQAGFTITKMWMTGASGTTTKILSNKTYSFTAIKFTR